jgi:hypothetical protein
VGESGVGFGEASSVLELVVSGGRARADQATKVVTKGVRIAHLSLFPARETLPVVREYSD